VSDINVVVLVGRLTRDSELKYTPSGYAICRFSIAVNRSKKQDDGWVDEPHYFDIEFYGKSAEALSKYLLKGRQVAVQGELRQDRWEKDGQQRSKVVIVASTIRPLGSQPQGQGTDAGNARKYAPDSVPAKPEPSNGQASIPPGVDEFTDDIPF
jgi:single-strand DNA-binding protein